MEQALQVLRYLLTHIQHVSQVQIIENQKLGYAKIISVYQYQVHPYGTILWKCINV